MALPQIDSSDTLVLPDGYHCAVTWGIPKDFGGMTNAMLHRSKAFVTHGKVPVDILTFEYSPDYDEIRCGLELSGNLPQGVRLRNFWEELIEIPSDRLPDRRNGAHDDAYAAVLTDSNSKDEVVNQVLRRKFRYAFDGVTILQIDYFRRNGSVAISDRRDITTPGQTGGRLITLCDWNGNPLTSWATTWPLYLFWLDDVVSGRETFMIVDSKYSAGFMTRYRRDHVITMYVVHGSHIVAGQPRPHGELADGRKYVFQRLQTFDSVVLLTHSQKKDVDAAFPGANTCCIPNSRMLPDAGDLDAIRPEAAGVVLSRLSGLKRLNHAISAIGRASKLTNTKFQLRIYGQGPQEKSLSSLIEKNGLSGQVTLVGHDQNAWKEYANASFTTLTSTSEGQPLVLIEAMSMGCIPISYDIAYGPADIIDDGVNGFLVADGDIDALAERIVRLGALDPAALAAMRHSARAKAVQLSDAVAVGRWQQEMASAVDRKLETALAK